MDIGKAISRAFDLLFKNIVVLAVAMLLVYLIGGITFGILLGPLMAGMVFICLKLIRGEKAEIGDVFKKFDKFAPAFLLSLLALVVGCVIGLLGMIPFLGFLISLAAGPLLGAAMALALCGIVDKNLELGPAIKEAVNRIKAKPLEMWLSALVFTILSSVGAIACGIGVLVTMPLFVLGLTLIYAEGGEISVQPTVSA